MSNLMNCFYSNLNDLISIQATDITTDILTCNTFKTTNFNVSSDFNIDGNLFLTGSIANGSNYITFNEPYQFTDFNQNIHIYGTGLINYNGNTYNIGQILDAFVGSGTITPYPSITYDSNNDTTTFIGNLSFSNNQINSSAINNNDFLTLTTNQSNITGQKQFSGTQVFLSLQINQDLILNSGTTLTNTQLSYLSGLTANIQTALTALQNKTQNQTATNSTTTFSNIVSVNSILITGTINTYTNTEWTNAITQTKSLTSSAQTQINSATNDIQVLKDTTRNLTATSSQSTFSQTLNSSTFTFNTINGFTSSDFSTAITNTKGLSSDCQNQLTALQDKTQYLSYSTNTSTSTFSNILKSSSFEFSNSINGYSTTSFATTIDYSRTLTSDSQSQHNASLAIATPALAASTANTTAIAGIITISIPALQAQITGQSAAISGNTNDISTLNQKTTNISFNNTTNRTSISSTTALSTLTFTTLNSGFTQDINSPITIIGTSEFKNGVSITNGFGLSVDGALVQNNNTASNTLAGSLTCSNNFSATGGTTQIGTGTTQSLNIYSKPTIYSSTIIKSNSTTEGGTIAPYLSVLSISTNTNQKKLQGIQIGREQTANNQSNCNVGYNYVSDGSLSNYGYLGLNVNTINTIESLRWFDGGCSVPVGNLTIASGNLTLTSGSINTNTINNQSSDLVITSTGTNKISLNSNIINIGTNQPINSANTINIGALTSLSLINLNGIVYSTFPINTTSTFSQWS